MEPEIPEWDENIKMVSKNATCSVSSRILDFFPFPENHFNCFFKPEELEGINEEELIKLRDILIPVWKHIIYFQPKPDQINEQLSTKSFPPKVITGILKTCENEQPKLLKIVEKVSSETCSGISRVEYTYHTTLESVKSSDSSEIPDRSCLLHLLLADKGQKTIQLSKQQLENLYKTVNDIQRSLDKLLER